MKQVCMPNPGRIMTLWQTCTSQFLTKDLQTHKLGSIHHLMSGLTTINTIVRHTLLPKSGDHRMIRDHSINFLHMFDVLEKFKVMSLIVEKIKRTAADQKRSCGNAPHIQMLINSRLEKGTYLLEKRHLPLGQILRTMKLSWVHPILHLLKARKRLHK